MVGTPPDMIISVIITETGSLGIVLNKSLPSINLFLGEPKWSGATICLDYAYLEIRVYTLLI